MGMGENEGIRNGDGLLMINCIPDVPSSAWQLWLSLMYCGVHNGFQKCLG